MGSERRHAAFGAGDLDGAWIGATAHTEDVPDLARILPIDRNGVVRRRAAILAPAFVVVVMKRARVHDEALAPVGALHGRACRRARAPGW